MPLDFGSRADFLASLRDVDAWRPSIVDALRRHGLATGSPELEPGVGGTFPTFLCGPVVIKCFGFLEHAMTSHHAERAAFGTLSGIDGLAAPRLLAEGLLFEDSAEPWPYLISQRSFAGSWDARRLSRASQSALARDLGRHLALVHGASCDGLLVESDWSTKSDLVEAAHSSRLPRRLTNQVAAYVDGVVPRQRVPVHGDLIDRHVLVEGGRVGAIIDWGDMIATDRHYELAKLHLSLFACDKSLLTQFLDASGWGVGPDFERLALVYAFHRHAHCCIQHTTCDVFAHVHEHIDLERVRTLDDLAQALFRV